MGPWERYVEWGRTRALASRPMSSTLYSVVLLMNLISAISAMILVFIHYDTHALGNPDGAWLPLSFVWMLLVVVWVLLISVFRDAYWLSRDKKLCEPAPYSNICLRNTVIVAVWCVIFGAIFAGFLVPAAVAGAFVADSF